MSDQMDPKRLVEAIILAKKYDEKQRRKARRRAAIRRAWRGW